MGRGGQPAFGDGELEHRLDSSEPVARLDCSPFLPAQHCWAVDEQDALYLGSERGVEESQESVRGASQGVTGRLPTWWHLPRRLGLLRPLRRRRRRGLACRRSGGRARPGCPRRPRPRSLRCWSRDSRFRRRVVLRLTTSALRVALSVFGYRGRCEPVRRSPDQTLDRLPFPRYHRPTTCMSRVQPVWA